MALAPDLCPANDGYKLVGSQRSSPSLLLLCVVMFLLVSHTTVLMSTIILRAVQKEKYIKDSEMQQTQRNNMELKKIHYTGEKNTVVAFP